MVGGSSAAAADVVRLSCDSALAGVSRFDVRGLVRALSEPGMLRAGLSALHRAPREVLLSRIAADTPLDYVGDVARFPGFARALGRTLDDLRMQRVGLNSVINSGRSGPDVARLAERYRQEIFDRRLVDYPARVEVAIAAARELPSIPDLLVYVAGPVARSERELLDVLTTRSPRSLEIAVDAPALPTGCEFLSASSEALEFVEIARRVLHSGLAVDRCAVLMRNPSRQLPLALEAFERAGIPTWMEHGVRLPDRSGRGFLSLLRCRETDYAVAEFCDYLSLAALPHEAEQRLSQGQWEPLLEQAAVVSGRERWQARLDATGEALVEKYQRSPAEGLARRIDALESLRGFALPLVDRLALLPPEATWREWIEHFEELAKYALADTRTIDGALDALRSVADIGGASFNDATRTLESLIGEWQDDEDESRYGKVFIGSVEQARGLSFDLVCVPGLNEGLFPRPPREDPLLLDTQRAELQIPLREDERGLLDIAIAAAGQRAIFSWSNVDLATGRQRILSFFAADLLATTRQTPVAAMPAVRRLDLPATRTNRVMARVTPPKRIAARMAAVSLPVLKV